MAFLLHAFTTITGIAGGVGVLKDLIKASDALIDGNRANYLNDVLGETVNDINPDIIYIPITAYGLKGPMRNIAGHDNNVLSLAGTLNYTSVSDKGTPSIFSAQLADITIVGSRGRESPLALAAG